MHAQIQLGDLAVDVLRKDIKNVHLSVHPPTGRVTISAPARMSLDTIRVFAISKLGWIRRQQQKLLEQERETPREYSERESHYLWGRRYLLEVSESAQAPSVELKHRRILLRVRPGANAEKRRSVIEEWYRAQLKQSAPPLVAKWEPLMGVKVAQIYVQRMKTKWGSCNPRTRSIRLNTELAKKPRSCLEYVIIHEMAHIIEPTHNARFMELMERFIPRWRHERDELNRLPLAHEDWVY